MAGIIHTHRWPASSAGVGAGQGIFLIHGIGEHAGRYDRFATHLAGLGYEVAAHDQPGHGKSEGKRGVLPYDNALVDAASNQFRQFEQQIGARPILFGHSLGGLVATSMVLENNVDVAALMLSAPAYAPIVSSANKMKLKLLAMLAPDFTQQLPYDAERLTHDKHEQALGRDDPLNHRYKSARFVNWIITAGERAIDAADTLDVPTLVLIPGADTVVDAIQTHAFVRNAPAALITSHSYDGFLHEILNETPERRQRVLNDIEQWLQGLKH